MLQLSLKKLFGLVWTTGELMEDVPALNAWMNRLLSLEAAFVVEDHMITGKGTTGPLGILNSDALITVSKEVAQVANTIIRENVEKMWQRLWIGSRRSAVWIVNGDAEPQLRTLESTNGAPLFQYSPDGEPLLMGRPMIAHEAAPALGSVGDLILADLTQYLIAEKEPNLLSSIHVRYLWHESVFKFRWRVDGQPAWKSPITPKNSSSTQSAFVTLEARS